MDASSKIPVFFRCKNEGDHGPPISIEWAYATPDHAEIVSAVHFVQPLPEWRAEIVAGQTAAAVRGISLGDLTKHGEAPAWIAERMNQVLAERELFSLAPQDGDSLLRLFEVAQVQAEFELHKVYADALIADLARLKRLPAAAFAKLERKAELRTPIYWPSVALAQMHALLWADVADAG